LYNMFSMIQLLCFLNLTYLCQHIITFVVTKKLGRFYEFPVIIHLSDTILFICSILIIDWFSKNINANVYTDPTITQEELIMRKLSNFGKNINFPFQYLFAVQITCLILRIAINLQFNESIGPLIKIVGKMVQDFFNFFLLYIIFTFMFAIIGNINFIYDLREYEGFFESILTVVDASLGNFDIAIF